MHSCEYTPEARTQLLGIARASVASGVQTGTTLTVDPTRCAPTLQQIRASFVTLTRHGELRGCTGSLEARQPLAADVAETAYRTALHDPRFHPVQIHELETVAIEISVLSPLAPIDVQSEAELISKLVPEVDGLVLEAGYRKATFLPKVWDQLPEPRTFLSELKRKAGVPPDYWSHDIRLYRYHTETFSDT